MIIENYGNYTKPGFGAHTLCVSWPEQDYRPKIWFSYEMPVAYQFTTLHARQVILRVRDTHISQTTRTHLRSIAIDPLYLTEEAEWCHLYQTFLADFRLTPPTINLHLDEKKGRSQTQ